MRARVSTVEILRYVTNAAFSGGWAAGQFCGWVISNSSLHQPLPLGPHCPLPTSNRLCKRLTASCTALKLVSFRYDGCSRRGVTALCPWQSLEKGVSSHMVVALRGPQSKRMNLMLGAGNSCDRPLIETEALRYIRVDPQSWSRAAAER